MVIFMLLSITVVYKKENQPMTTKMLFYTVPFRLGDSKTEQQSWAEELAGKDKNLLKVLNRAVNKDIVGK